MEDPDVQAGFPEYIKSIDPNNAHPSWHTADVKQNIYNYLMAKDLDPEMTSSQYKNFMIWHRGLAVPAARNTTTDRFKQGMKLFKEIGCANCLAIRTRRFGPTPTLCSTVCSWRTTYAQAGAAPHRSGAVGCQSSAQVPKTVCTTAAHATPWRQSCGMATPRATPATPLRSSAS